MRYFVVPNNLYFSPRVRCAILTDDYTAEEVTNRTLHEHVRADVAENSKMWGSKYAFCYPMKTSGGVSLNDFIRVEL